MKLRVTFKTPDAVNDAIEDEIAETDDYEFEKEKLKNFTKKWVSYGEYVTIEFDTEEGTARVVPC